MFITIIKSCGLGYNVKIYLYKFQYNMDDISYNICYNICSSDKDYSRRITALSNELWQRLPGVKKDNIIFVTNQYKNKYMEQH